MPKSTPDLWLGSGGTSEAGASVPDGESSGAAAEPPVPGVVTVAAAVGGSVATAGEPALGGVAGFAGVAATIGGPAVLVAFVAFVAFVATGGVADAVADATAAAHTLDGDGGAAGVPTDGTYRKPSASPSPRVRVEMPTLASCQLPPSCETKTAQ